MFEEIDRRQITTPGVRESEASNAIRDLAADMFDVSRYWHKRIVRSGPNTLLPYRENPPDRLIEDDDIAFADFGPIFQAWEADFGRTFVLGDDPVKHQLRDALPGLFDAGRDFFSSSPLVTGAQRYARVAELAEETGWELGGEIAGHLVGEFPHEKIAGDQIEWYIAPGSDQPMRRHDRTGRVCHWILEIHLIDRGRQIGAGSTSAGRNRRAAATQREETPPTSRPEVRPSCSHLRAAGVAARNSWPQPISIVLSAQSERGPRLSRLSGCKVGGSSGLVIRVVHSTAAAK